MTAVPVFENVASLREQVAIWHDVGERVVLVPTMGALHQGHRALVTHAKTLGQRVIASIFVNPTQFGPNEDFSRYPRTIEVDLATLSEAGADAAYIPDTKTMYPLGFTSRIEPNGPSEGLCGEFRPGHFAGVATVVTKLINQTRADVALFGEKDFQQLQVIRRVVRDLDMSVDIAGMPTMRESDGLALSSRNRYLNEVERRIAPRLHAVLVETARKLVDTGLVTSTLASAKAELERTGFGPVQYLELRDAQSFKPLTSIEAPARLLTAAYLGQTRLIDNIAVEPKA